MELHTTSHPTYTPRLSRPRRRASIVLEERDLELLLLLWHRPYTRSRYVPALLGGSRQGWQRRLKQLWWTGYVRRPPEQQTLSGDFKTADLIYALDERGIEALTTAGHLGPDAIDLRPGRSAPRHNLAHDVMITDALNAIDYGLRNRPSFRMVEADEILAGASMQPGQRSPLAIPLSSGAVIPDAIFGIEGPAGFILYALEVDNHTEQYQVRSNGGSSYASKLEQYARVVQTRAYQPAYGVRAQMMVLHLFRTARRKDNILRTAASAPYNLFGVLPTDGRGHPVVTGSLIALPWDRQGFSPFPLDR